MAQLLTQDFVLKMFLLSFVFFQKCYSLCRKFKIPKNKEKGKNGNRGPVIDPMKGKMWPNY